MLDRKIADQSKKRGAMKLVNIMFDLYFRLNNYRLCTPLTKILQGPGYPDLEEYPLSHVTTYRFYTGRLHLFDGKYAEAEVELSSCFSNIPQKVRIDFSLRFFFFFFFFFFFSSRSLPTTSGWLLCF